MSSDFQMDDGPQAGNLTFGECQHAILEDTEYPQWQPDTIDNPLPIPHNSPDMLKIRLRRMGAKKKPSYRLVVVDSRAPRDGASLSIIGHYDPLTDPETVVIKEEEALKWLGQGAQPTATASRLLSKTGIMDKFKTTKEKA